MDARKGARLLDKLILPVKVVVRDCLRDRGTSEGGPASVDTLGEREVFAHVSKVVGVGVRAGGWQQHRLELAHILIQSL